VTCGSAIKLQHAATKFRLHSHEIACVPAASKRACARRDAASARLCRYSCCLQRRTGACERSQLRQRKWPAVRHWVSGRGRLEQLVGRETGTWADVPPGGADRERQNHSLAGMRSGTGSRRVACVGQLRLLTTAACRLSIWRPSGGCTATATGARCQATRRSAHTAARMTRTRTTTGGVLLVRRCAHTALHRGALTQRDRAAVSSVMAPGSATKRCVGSVLRLQAVLSDLRSANADCSGARGHRRLSAQPCESVSAVRAQPRLRGGSRPRAHKHFHRCRPIAGQHEVCGVARRSKDAEWMAAEGIYYPDATAHGARSEL
jgi:hypothetical protein